ncbi:MAG: hypothetical protein ACRYFZ_09570 [Janthinobacterium lividum]
MADDLDKPAPDPTTLPGGAAFDVDNASDADYKEHKKILTRRKEVADLAVTPSVALESTTTAPEQHDPTDIVAVHPELGTRRFSSLAWKTLETNGEHGGWEVEVAKPETLPTV